MREKDGKRIKYTKRLLWARYRARFFTFSNLILRTTLKEKNYYLFSIDEEIAASYIDDKWRNLPRSPIIFDFFSMKLLRFRDVKPLAQGCPVNQNWDPSQLCCFKVLQGKA